VLNELLNNACKYTPAGEQITIAAKAMGAIETLTTETLVTETLVTETLSSPELILQSHPGRVTDNCTQELLTQVVDAAPPIAPAAALCFSITNSGVEIPPEERDRIFDKFYRIPSNDPWKHGGTGLGLALVKGLVERLQGQIEVVSAAGLTTFVVQLPLTVNP
jgi:signal transduction histidine kinase